MGNPDALSYAEPQCHMGNLQCKGCLSAMLRNILGSE